MFEVKKVHITTHSFMSVGLIIACLTGVILAQTFHYSRGWTNGKKRAPLTPAVYDSMQEPESFGLCKMQTLKHILEHKHHSEESLPCKVFDTYKDDSRQRKDDDFDNLSLLDMYRMRIN